MSEVELPQTKPQATEDARALLARLYREIGVSAVAAALHLQDMPQTERKASAERSAPVTARGDTLAA
jgi:tRNA(Ile)-lysidine synthase TilS/MesJ